MAKKRNKAIVVPHTHWDREWRYPIWTNRRFLVEFMDELLDVLERDPNYRNFVTDGQCVLIEDYLRVRPENEPRVRKAIADGRLSIGPWYTLPDLYPIDGECLVRNLLKGLRLSERLGGAMRLGYNSFGWGQTAQFPQIYAGFGFEFIIAAKRVSRQRAPKCEFLWESPDGTRVLTTRLGDHARANVFFNAYIRARFGVDYSGDEYRFDWRKAGVVLHPADPGRQYEDHSRLWAEEEYHEDEVRPGFEAAWAAMDETTVPDCRLLMDGSDFTNCQPVLTRLLEDANAAFDDIEFVHGTLAEYAGELANQVDRDALPVVRGEMRDGPASHCSGNALAVRNYVKTANKQAQNWLLRRAEPLAVALATLGAEYPTAMLETAWRYLLQAHPHDSINGVTQDKTADDTLYRIRQAEEIAQVVADQAVGELAARIDTSAFAAGDVLLLAVNPLARPSGGVVKLCVDTPREDAVWEFDLTDAEGNAYDIQPVAREERTSPINDLSSRPWPFHLDRHTVWADLGELPPCGYKVLRVHPTREFDRRAEWWPVMRTSPGGEISPAPGVLENEHLLVEAAGDGTLTLTDKATGRTFAGLHAFEDAGDVGDYWAYYPPYGNQTHTSRGRPARVWVEESGPLAATLVVEVTITLPARAEAGKVPVRGGSRRVDETRELVITSRFTLRRGERRLDCRTTLTNNVEDHRLRVLFPTNVAATHAHASGHFTVDARLTEPPREPDGTYWPEMQTLPTQHFVDLSDERGGFAVVHNSFTEYEVLRDGRATLALTLFRAVRNRICTEFRSTGDFPDQKGGQCLREMEFGYALCPHDGDWATGDVYAAAETLNVPPMVYQTTPHDRGSLPPEGSFFAVESGNLIVSAVKKAEDRDTFIVRLFNPTGDTLDGRVMLPDGAAKAWRTNLEENREEELPVTGGRVELSVPTGKIVTIEFTTEMT